MSKLEPRTNKEGKITGYRKRICVGRNEKGEQVWRTHIFPCLGLTPAKERKEVERLAAEWEQEQRELFEKNRAEKDPERMTFAAFVNEFWLPLDVRDGQHAPNTVRFYEDRARRIVDYFGKKPLKNIGILDCKQFVAYMRKEAKKPDGTPLSATTIESDFKVLRGILESAKRMKLIKENPCDDFRPSERPHKDTDKKIDYLPLEQAQRFIECLNNEGGFWRSYFVLLLMTGLRRSEALGLQWKDLNAQEMTLTVSRSITRDPNSETLISVRKPKNKKSRVVPITSAVLELLQERKAEQFIQFGVVLPHAYIFSKEDNAYSPVYPTTPTKKLQRIVKKNGLPEFSPHDLRHSFATLSLRGGAGLSTIKDTLGHSSIEVTTKFYAAVLEEAKREAAEGVEKMLMKHNAG